MIPFHSIKTKFVLASVLLVLLFSLSWGGHVVVKEKRHLYHTLESQGRLLLTTLQRPIINTMILKEMEAAPGLLDNYVEEVIKNPDFPAVYAFITDPQGKVLSHNRTEELGVYYRDPLTRQAIEGNAFVSRYTADPSGQRILDMGIPLRIGTKKWGAFRVGFSCAAIEEEFNAFTLEIVLFAVVLSAASTVVLYAIGAAMARPIEELAAAMGAIDLGALTSATFPPRRDEIGDLQTSFQRMVERLGRSERERERAMNQLIHREKMATIGEIVAGVAHEIGNPMAAMSAALYEVERKLPPEGKECGAVLKGGMERIQKILRQLTDFSRKGGLELARVPSDLFFSETAAFATMATKKYRVELAARDLCQPPVPLEIDKGKLHQVVLNLVLNATVASPPDGVIELTAALSPEGYRLTVLDRGEGIPAEELDKVFEIFYTTKPAGTGTGIGLAVCKDIVDLHHGEIAVASRKGETVFTVTIPVRQTA
ncbi:ATP-binding protein [Geomonas sp. Red32]|uniref:sensor histidine kinase n=1 Tax=Geomonas sp. Red32 TaxID=2912856 RepID=UPI00202CEF06|nr:ATP-binding protein [Geomonas sp. Red32]MCM0082764.1 ATP-binding protein [Geomonas sp. Red32]